MKVLSGTTSKGVGKAKQERGKSEGEVQFYPNSACHKKKSLGHKLYQTILRGLQGPSKQKVGDEHIKLGKEPVAIWM